METLETLARQVDTTEDLRGIVGTMKSLAAVSIRQYEQAAEALADYADTVERGLKILLLQRSLSQETKVKPSDGPVGLVVFGSDHGLCGRFNAEVVAKAMHHDVPAGVQRRWLAVGGRAADRLQAEEAQVEQALSLPSSADGLVETAHALIEAVEAWRQDGVGHVLLVHNRREQQAPAKPVVQQMLPLDPAWLQRLQNEPWPERGVPIHRAPADELFTRLVRQHLFVVVFRAAAESLASEHASRLASMQAAERNIDERLEELRGGYRHRRQQTITEELLDVVSGFEALGGGDNDKEEAEAGDGDAAR